MARNGKGLNLLKKLWPQALVLVSSGAAALGASVPWWDNFPRMIITSDLATAQAYSATAALNDVANDPGWGLWFNYNGDSGASDSTQR
jgi:hypothetical protein